MAAKDGVGKYGERVAARYLLDAGMVLLERNWRCPEGEVDIIARDADTLVFCEVKTRSGDSHGTPADAVTPTKVARLRRLAKRWLAVTQLSTVEVRFDVVCVRPRRSGPATVEHLRGAF
ncbi:YraN family protein [Longispora sp. NPDC051575]|uniref:YraN family protein n=1 Tax=Longispora sp. NPDC051575 TaxID=3154943 RepID=UPI003431BA2E